MIVPREIFGDSKAEVFGVVDDLKLLAMILLRRLLVMRSTSHLSGLNDICQVLSQFCRASMSSWSLVASASVLMGLYRRQSCSQCDTRWHVVYVNEKKQGTKDSALGDARSHFTLCRVFTFEDYFLGATGEKVCNPRQSITSHSKVVEFQEKTSVGNFIEGL